MNIFFYLFTLKHDNNKTVFMCKTLLYLCTLNLNLRLHYDSALLEILQIPTLHGVVYIIILSL